MRALWAGVIGITTGVWHRLARAKIVSVLARQRKPPTIESVRATLRQALRDDTVEVLFWLAARRVYVDGDARVVERLPGPAQRAVVPVLSRSGEPLALILVHPATPRTCPLTEVTVAAARLALENVQLQAAMGAQVAELRTARTRVAELAMRERRQLERDLHDGTQQRLLGLAARLALARTMASDTGTREALDDARSELRGVGYLLKERVDDIDTLNDALAQVTSGRLTIDESIVTLMMSDLRTPAELDRLSEREKAILAVMAEGRSNLGIAHRLSLSTKTVENYLTAIFSKLGLANSSDDNRRVLATLLWLRVHQQQAPVPGPSERHGVAPARARHQIRSWTPPPRARSR